MTCSPSVVVSTCSSAPGRPAAAGAVRDVVGTGNIKERCWKNSTAVPPRYPTMAASAIHFRTVMWKGEVSHPFDDILGHLLGVAEQHHGVVAVEQRVVDARVTRSQRALDEHHGAGFPHLQHRHAVDRR